MLWTSNSERLNAARALATSGVLAEKFEFENMVTRATTAGEPPDAGAVQLVLARIAQIEARVSSEADIKELEDLVKDARRDAQLRAYICPTAEIYHEGILNIDLMGEWNIPKSKITTLRETLVEKLKRAATDRAEASGALRAIYEEADSWADYTSEYEEEMLRYVWWLFFFTIGLVSVAVLLLAPIGLVHFPRLYPSAFFIGLSAAGAAGSCVSIMTKMPVIEVALDGELEAYKRRILSRISVGVIASLIGCAFLGWGVISISSGGSTFADIINTCSAPALGSSCTAANALMLLGLAMVLGFSERALTSFEQQIFGR